MAISGNDIQFKLSGGRNNSNPSLSIGGEMSSFPVIGTVNNIFRDVTKEEALSGKTDYRCVYIHNESDSETLFNTSLAIDAQGSAGSNVQMGISIATEIQTLQIKGNPTSGSLVLLYGSRTFEVNWSSNFSTFADSFISSLNLPGTTAQLFALGGGVQSGASQELNLTLQFSGNQDKRSHPRIEIKSNNLIGVDKPIVTFARSVSGAPVNSTAPTVASEIANPNGVIFSSQPIQIGELRPGDKIPIWFKRNTPPATQFSDKDFFVLRISGSPLSS